PGAAGAGPSHQSELSTAAESAAFFTEHDIVFIPTRKSLGLPNPEGRYRIIRSTGEEVTRFEYTAKDHYRGLESTKGRSLFRPALAAGLGLLPSQFGPWASSTSAEGATPGVVHARPSPKPESKGLQVAPLSFYPNRIDLAHEVLIHIPPVTEGLTLTLDVFDRQGYVAASLSRGQFLADGWTTSWRGQNDQDFPCPTGVYIAVARIFDDKGREIRRFKQPISLIR
ncbi:MAG: hypothetical protein O3B41_04815, partial [Bacteroidetes bacterium]|nr:hypothetical protein [Bacteroidota bacterium]